MHDVLIVGGGVIGLSLAYELAAHGVSVQVLERGALGEEASWAGAGIVPPAKLRSAAGGDEQLAALSFRLHPEWAERLREETGIDTGFRRCGGIYIARDGESVQRLEVVTAYHRACDVAVERLTTDDLCRLEPNTEFDRAAPSILAAYLLPEECQLRNPRHLKALAAACHRRGVTITTGADVQDARIADGRVQSVKTSLGDFTAGKVCLTSGAWSGALAGRFGVTLPIKPIQGQIVLLASRAPVLSRVVSEGSRYLVPRPDGRVLIGSTEDDVGFDKHNTPLGVSGLLEFGLGLVPALRKAAVERCWAGLRPNTPDGLPYLGAIPGLENAYIAAGHFRSGLTLSTGTAVVMSQVIRGEESPVDLAAFRIDRE